jgi:hypothetical protein
MTEEALNFNTPPTFLINMKRELVGILTRSQDQPAIKDEEGKVRLVYNLFDGLSGKKVKVTVETLED